MQFSAELSAEHANAWSVMQSLTCACGTLILLATSLVVISLFEIIPINRPALSTTGSAAHSSSLIKRAALSTLSSGRTVTTDAVIRSRAVSVDKLSCGCVRLRGARNR